MKRDGSSKPEREEKQEEVARHLAPGLVDEVHLRVLERVVVVPRVLLGAVLFRSEDSDEKVRSGQEGEGTSGDAEGGGRRLTS